MPRTSTTEMERRISDVERRLEKVTKDVAALVDDIKEMTPEERQAVRDALLGAVQRHKAA